MMNKIDRKKIAYAILWELNQNNKEFYAKDFNIEKSIYIDIIKAIVHDELAQGFEIIGKGDVTVVIAADAYITLNGAEFLEKNSQWGKAYKGIKEFASWIPGFG